LGKAVPVEKSIVCGSEMEFIVTGKEIEKWY
jgi:hypothetical protein